MCLITNHIIIVGGEIMVTKKKINNIQHLMHDFLIGSVVKYRLKCGKNCTCNNGKKHIKFYLSITRKGKTKLFYLPPKSVKQAKKMSQRYKKLKFILEEFSRINYKDLKNKYLTRKPRATNN